MKQTDFTEFLKEHGIDAGAEKISKVKFDIYGFTIEKLKFNEEGRPVLTEENDWDYVYERHRFEDVGDWRTKDPYGLGVRRSEDTGEWMQLGLDDMKEEYWDGD